MNNDDQAAKTTRLSRNRYILYFGVLGWGLFTAVIFTAWNLHTKPKMSATEMIVPFVIFPLAGILWGVAMWSFTKKRREQVARNEDHGAEPGRKRDF